MFVKSEFPLDSALVGPYAIVIQKKLGRIFLATSKVIKSKLAAVEFMKCALCHIFATS